MSKKNKSIKMTLPQDKIIHGFTIRKVPMGEYIKALQDMQQIPDTLLNDYLGGLDLTDIILTFGGGDNSEILSMLANILIKSPEPLVKILCQIVRIDPEEAMQRLTPAEMVDVVKAFWELNDMTNFFKVVRGAVKKQLLALSTGFKNG